MYRKDVLWSAWRRCLANMMSWLKLTVNETKTQLCRVPEETFDFLGYTFGRCYSPRTGGAYIGSRPARKKIRRLCDSLDETLGRRTRHLDEATIVGRLNRKLRGWANYFQLGPVRSAYRGVDRYARNGLRRWMCKKHKVPGRGTARYPDAYLDVQLGLVRLCKLKRGFPASESMTQLDLTNPCPRAGCGKTARPVR